MGHTAGTKGSVQAGTESHPQQLRLQNILLRGGHQLGLLRVGGDGLRRDEDSGVPHGASAGKLGGGDDR